MSYYRPFIDHLRKSTRNTNRRRFRPIKQRNNQAPISLEALEDRRLLAVTVSNDSDLVNGDVSSVASLVASDGGDGISLREAIVAANNTTGADTVEFAPALSGSTITLSGSRLDVTDSLTVAGPGASLLTIDGNQSSSVLVVNDGSIFTDIDVNISGLKITGGNTSFDGGGITNTENLVLHDMIITDNHGSGGGGIKNVAGNLTVSDTVVSQNTSSTAGGGLFNSGTASITASAIENNIALNGGGIANRATLSLSGNTVIADNLANGAGGIDNSQSATAHIVETHILRNESTGSNGGGLSSNGTVNISDAVIQGNIASNNGGGIFNGLSGTLTISRSSLAENSSSAGGALYNANEAVVIDSILASNSANTGGGIANSGDSPTVKIINSTLSGNNANLGGGVFNNSGATNEVTIINSTLADNSASTNGGGLSNFGTATLSNSIVSNSTMGSDVDGTGVVFTTGVNIIQDGSIAAGANVIVADPLLGPLADNGGPTQTHAILPGSPAVNAGDNSLAVDADGNPLAFDQRGNPFVRIPSGAVDIGAFELQAYLVDTLLDESDGDFSKGDLSLREAIELSNANPLIDEIYFDAALAGGTITLAGTELAITNDLTIHGLGRDLLAVDGNDLSRVFNVSDASSSETKDVVISGLTIQGGNAGTTNGGGILNDEYLILNDSRLTANTGISGGGLSNSSRALATIVDSIVSQNTTSSGDGGGIYNQGTATVVDSTVNGNHAAGVGGGLKNRGTISIERSTISDNSATTGTGGGGVNNSRTATITGSTFSNNFVSTGSRGGGLTNQDRGTTSIINSLFEFNNANQGGAILNYGGVVNIEGTTLTNNSADGEGGAIASSSIHGAAIVNLSGSVVSGNSASRSGGGFINYSPSRATIVDSLISANFATSFGGGLYNVGTATFVNSEVVNNETSGSGGGISNSIGSLQIEGSTFSGNVASNNGGAVWNAGSLTMSDSKMSENHSGFQGGGIRNHPIGTAVITDSIFSDNQAVRGGGLSNAGTLTVVGSSIHGNNASDGGGIQNRCGSLNCTATAAIINSTLSANDASFRGGGLFNSEDGAVSFTHSTIYGNSANSSGGGIGNLGAATLTNSIVANSAMGGDVVDSGTLTTNGVNIVADGSLTASTHVIVADPELGPLLDNGGSTPTHAVPLSSPAINSGDNSVAKDANGNPLVYDQRGASFFRIMGGSVDIGAFELQIVNQAPVPSVGGPYVVDEGSSLNLDASLSSDVDGDELTFDWDINGDGIFGDASGEQPALTPSELAVLGIVDGPNTYAVTVRVSDGQVAETDSTTLTVNNVAPHDVTIDLIGSGGGVFPIGTLSLVGSFADYGIVDTHSAKWTLSHAVDQTVVVQEINATVDQLAGTVNDIIDFGDSGAFPNLGPGVYTATLTVTDNDGGETTSSQELFVVYDASEGFVTGGGWINSPAGAYRPDETLTGKANFGFVSKYKKGATVPSGNTEFQFKAADFEFQSTSYQWMVVAGARAQFKGTGEVNGQAGFAFMLTVTDSDLAGGGDQDRFRIKIWAINPNDDSDASGVIYDNNVHDSSDDADPESLASGSIVIHKGGGKN